MMMMTKETAGPRPERAVGPQVAVDQITMTEISYRDGFYWAKIRLQEKSGFVSIQSDYGNWSFGWPHHGRPSLAYFLAHLDVAYMGNKMLGAGLDVFDPEASRKAIKAHIIESRREAGVLADLEAHWATADYQRNHSRWLYGSGKYPGPQPEKLAWTKTRARKEWELCSSIDNSFDDWYSETSIQDAWEIAYCTRMQPSWRNFWDRIWEPHIKPKLRELAEAR